MEDFTLVRKRGQKHIRMYFKDSGQLIVSAPFSSSESEIESFVLANSKWIEKNKTKIPSHSYENGDQVMFQGENCQLFVIKGSPKSSSCLPERILLTVPHPEKTDTVKKELYSLYSKVLRSFCLSRVDFWCNKLNVPVPELEICNSKTRWGVCYASRNVVKISAITASLPKHLQEMILVHELCHLVYCNHGDKFHALMKTLIPDIENLEKQLKTIDKSGLHKNLF